MPVPPGLLVPSLWIEGKPNQITALWHVTHHQVSRPTALPVSTEPCWLVGVIRLSKLVKECRFRVRGRTTSVPDFKINSTSDPSEMRVSAA
jgi:hypothetical protein